MMFGIDGAFVAELVSAVVVGVVAGFGLLWCGGLLWSRSSAPELLEPLEDDDDQVDATDIGPVGFGGVEDYYVGPALNGPHFSDYEPGDERGADGVHRV